MTNHTNRESQENSVTEPERLGSRKVSRKAAAVVVAGTLTVGLAGGWFAHTVPSSAGRQADAPAGSVTAQPATLRDLLAKSLPTVVSVKATTPSGVGQGSGVIISPDGEVLTNAHVVAGSSEVSVTRYGSQAPVQAHVVGVSTGDDLALLRVPGVKAWPAAPLGSSASVQVGDPVVAVGNALGLQAGSPTVTTGIVSAQGRTITTDTGSTITGIIQTDAAINPGNSGGPLFDQSGRVVAINTAVPVSPSGGAAQNMGMAIPIDKARSMLPVLRNGGPAGAARVELGVRTVTLSDDIRSAYGLSPRSGALIVAVKAGSPAAVAGLAAGDVITASGKTPIVTSEDLTTALSSAHPGQRISLGVTRGTTSDTVQVTLAAPTR